MKNLLVGASILGIVAACANAQGQRFRDHDTTSGGPLTLVPADQTAGSNQVAVAQSGSTRILTGNGLPDHLVGSFPNAGNPHAITTQNVSLSMPLTPQKASMPTELPFGWTFGVSLEGVAFDPLAAEFWGGDPNSGWSYNALGGAIRLGLDENHAHVQPSGAYHYHGVPLGLLEMTGWTSDTHSPLIGYAADGFPIYALTGVVNGEVTKMTSSYQLIAGSRPGGSQPDGQYDGTFNEDYAYVAGSGTLDQCNGAMTVSAEYPNGTYAYFLSEDYPVIPRCWMGTPDDSFRLPRRN